MDNFLREIESEDVVIYTDQVYSADLLNKCREIHRKLVIEGKMEGEFNSDKWMGYSGVRKYGIKFTMNASLYYKHMGKEFEIPIETMKNMLRCYAIYYNGVYIYNTIARNKIYIIKHFLMRYRDKDFELTTEDIVTVKEFLGFINTPNEQIEKIISYIKLLHFYYNLFISYCSYIFNDYFTFYYFQLHLYYHSISFLYRIRVLFDIPVILATS